MTEPKSLLKHYLHENYNWMLQSNGDHLTIVSGKEGSGKSAFAVWAALELNPDFDSKKQVVYDLKSLMNFFDAYQGVKGRVCIVDEAVLIAMGEDSQTKESKLLKQVFITHRDLGHMYFMVSPSPFLLSPYMRNWRAKDFYLIYGNPTTVEDIRYVAYYTRKAYAPMICSPHGKQQIMFPWDFVRTHKPTHIEYFPLPKGDKYDKVFDEVFEMKKEAQSRLRQKIDDIQNQDAPQQSDTELRNKYIKNSINYGLKTKDASVIFGVSVRTIERIITTAT